MLRYSLTIQQQHYILFYCLHYWLPLRITEHEKYVQHSSTSLTNRLSDGNLFTNTSLRIALHVINWRKANGLFKGLAPQRTACHERPTDKHKYRKCYGHKGLLVMKNLQINTNTESVMATKDRLS